jgi:hypothetical protein
MIVPDSSASDLAALQWLSNSKKLSHGRLIEIGTLVHARRKLSVSDWDYLNQFFADAFVQTSTPHNNRLRLWGASSPEYGTHGRTLGKNRHRVEDSEPGRKGGYQSLELWTVVTVAETVKRPEMATADGADPKNDMCPDALSLKQFALTIVLTKQMQSQASLSQSSPPFLEAYPSSRGWSPYATIQWKPRISSASCWYSPLMVTSSCVQQTS